MPADVNAGSILHAVAAAPHLLEQEDRRSTFGRPPITLWRNRDFYVAALFWLDGTTTYSRSRAGRFAVSQRTPPQQSNQSVGRSFGSPDFEGVVWIRKELYCQVSLQRCESPNDFVNSTYPNSDSERWLDGMTLSFLIM